MTMLSREALEVEALRTDRYLESILDGSGRPATGIDGGLAATAARLRRDLTRVHPSFRFEERLARRLADIAASMRLPAAAGAEGARFPLVPFPLTPDLEPDPAAFEDEEDGPGVSRPVLIGGAVASAAISLAGAAIVAWRLGRSSGEPMARVGRVLAELRPGPQPPGSGAE